MTCVDSDVSPNDTGGVVGNDSEHVFHDLRGIPPRHKECVESQHPDLRGVPFSARPSQQDEQAHPRKAYLVSGKNIRESIGIIPAVLSIMLNLKYAKSADVGVPYGISLPQGQQS